MNLIDLKKKISESKKVDFNDIDIKDVDEITDIKIDKRKSSNERLVDFLNKTKNPYVFSIKGKLVKISFSNTEKTADDCLTSVLKNLYK